jgi:hypothetical protein
VQSAFLKSNPLPSKSALFKKVPDELQVYKICDHVDMRVEILDFSSMNYFFLTPKGQCSQIMPDVSLLWGNPISQHFVADISTGK